MWPKSSEYTGCWEELGLKAQPRSPEATVRPLDLSKALVSDPGGGLSDLSMTDE